MGNIIAIAALLSWPLVTLLLFASMSTQRAVITSLLAGYLLLPNGFGIDLPGIPTLDKTSVPNISAFLLAMAFAPRGAFRWPRSIMVNLLLTLWVFCPIFTTFSNGDIVSIGTVALPALSLYDAFSAAAEHAIEIMPFIVGVGLFRADSSHRDMLAVLVVAAVVYCIPMLLEIVKGPYLQAVIYHVDPGTMYSQQMRDGGWRAMVFLGHGLAVSSFIAVAIIGAIGLSQGKWRVMGLPAALIAAGLFGMLILNKSAGALVIGTVISFFLIVTKPRSFISLTLVFAAMIMTYPILRGNGLVPTNAVMSIASSFSAERASSLGYRLRNEDMLLNRANERPLFGWGGYGRNRVFMVTNWGATVDVSVTDGAWIIALGTNGWLGYLSMFGLLCYPFWHLFRLRRQAISPVTAALAAMVLYTLFDLIPNSGLPPTIWLLCGALAGLPKLRQMRRLPASMQSRLVQIPAAV